MKCKKYMISVYKKIESFEKNIEITNNTDTSMMFVNQQTGYWTIKTFIEVNFMED